ncbi:MAG: hypothetical protein M1817_002991 [Caeruleum heppii]|nr:MAG: hypothetical protein M1817_002991 [Caeruleum heppii]
MIAFPFSSPGRQRLGVTAILLALLHTPADGSPFPQNDLQEPTLESRQTTVQLMCSEQVPLPGNQTGFPQYAPEKYPSHRQLCAVNSDLSSVGCSCAVDGAVLCRPMGGVFELSHSPPLRRWCQANCMCVNPKATNFANPPPGGAGAGVVAAGGGSSAPVSPDGSLDNICGLLSSEDSAYDNPSGEGDESCASGSDAARQAAAAGISSAPTPTPSNGTEPSASLVTSNTPTPTPKDVPSQPRPYCINAPTAVLVYPPRRPYRINLPNARVSWGGPLPVGNSDTQAAPKCNSVCSNDNPTCADVRTKETPCMCYVYKQPSAGSYFFRGSCGVIGKKKRKRDDDGSDDEGEDFDGGLNGALGCACNGSYVSQACCDADEDGLVWEHPRMKLGQLPVG